jgi:hypothetical protein
MVAMTISLLLLAGVLSVLYTSRLTYDENTRFARLQEYARSSLELMLRDLRGAGYPGCARAIDTDDIRNLITTPNSLRYNLTRPVEGFEGTDGVFAPAIDATVLPSATVGNDVLVIRTIASALPPFVTNANYAGGAAAVHDDRRRPADAREQLSVGEHLRRLSERRCRHVGHAAARHRRDPAADDRSRDAAELGAADAPARPRQSGHAD